MSASSFNPETQSFIEVGGGGYMGTWGAFFTYTIHVNRLYWQPLSLMTWSTSVFSHPNEKLEIILIQTQN